jgi:cytochrome c556
MKTIVSLALAAAVSALAVPAHAQFAKPEDAVKYRQSALSVMGTHFTRIGAMVNGRVPFDARVAQENAQIVNDMARLPWSGFGPGADKLSAKAKPEIWTEQAKFKDHADKLTAETAKLLAAAKTQNLDTLKSAFGATAGSCKACHDALRGS